MTHFKNGAPETKVALGDAQSVAELFDDFMEAFEAFKEINNERLSQVEKRMGEDVVTVEKMNRINRKMDEQKLLMDTVLLQQKRPDIGGVFPGSAADIEHKNAFLDYFRHGQENDLRRFEKKALSYTSDPDGGYLVPDETATEIGRRLTLGSPIRSIAGIQMVSSSNYKKPFAIKGPVSGWVADSDTRSETASPSLAEMQFPTMELYAMPAATSQLLDDAMIDVDAWIASEVEQVFAEQENTAFVKGNGTKQPKGFLHESFVEEGKWEWGKLGYVATGVNAAFAVKSKSDILVDTIYALKAGYRQNANWVMNRKTQAEIRKLKDADGNYLWRAPSGAGQAASLMGFPVVEAEDMPDIAAGTHSIAFGDFQRGYLIVDRAGIRVLRDPYSAKPHVLFYITKRVGGGVQDFDAIKFVKFGTA